MRTLVEGHAHAGAVGLLQIERLHHLAHVLPAELPPGLLVYHRNHPSSLPQSTLRTCPDGSESPSYGRSERRRLLQVGVENRLDVSVPGRGELVQRVGACGLQPLVVVLLGEPQRLCCRSLRHALFMELDKEFVQHLSLHLDCSFRVGDMTSRVYGAIWMARSSQTGAIRKV